MGASREAFGSVPHLRWASKCQFSLSKPSGGRPPGLRTLVAKRDSAGCDVQSTAPLRALHTYWESSPVAVGGGSVSGVKVTGPSRPASVKGQSERRKGGCHRAAAGGRESEIASGHRGSAPAIDIQPCAAAGNRAGRSGIESARVDVQNTIVRQGAKAGCGHWSGVIHRVAKADDRIGPFGGTPRSQLAELFQSLSPPSVPSGSLRQRRCGHGERTDECGEKFLCFHVMDWGLQFCQKAGCTRSQRLRRGTRPHAIGTRQSSNDQPVLRLHFQQCPDSIQSHNPCGEH